MLNNALLSNNCMLLRRDFIISCNTRTKSERLQLTTNMSTYLRSLFTGILAKCILVANYDALHFLDFVTVVAESNELSLLAILLTHDHSFKE